MNYEDRIRMMREVKARLFGLFGLEAALRSHREAMVPRYDCEHLEPEWQATERRVMCEAVNVVRRLNGLARVSLVAIERAERPALGHSDYASKFALYCAELACGLDNP